MHVLWVSDSPDTPSGFGNVTRFVCEGLARRGHRVSVLGWQTREVSPWNGCTLYPVGSDPMGGDALFRLLVRHRPDAVIALADVWWLPYFAAPHIRRQMELTDTPWILYFPIDGNTADGRLPESWIEFLKEVDVRIAMSRYGQSVVAACGISSHYIPHGVDLDIFSPPADRAEAKARIGARDRFVVLSDSRNQPRKLLPRLLDVFAKFSVARPDALLHLHTDPVDEFTRSGVYSYDVRADVGYLNIESKVRFTSGLSMKPGGGLALSELAVLYQAADVHLLASSGEGFGLPTLQAAAAGAVPMAGAYTASLELVEGHGAPIAVAEWAENEFGIRRGLIDIDDAVSKLARYYDDRAMLAEHSRRSRQFAMSYGWAEVVDQWDSVLRSLRPRGRRLVGMPAARSGSLERFVPKIGGGVGAASVTVKVAERQHGKLEASILSDARKQTSDVRLPAMPSPCQVGRVRVPRQTGLVGLDHGDATVFGKLSQIFPILEGWVPVSPAQKAAVHPPLRGVPAASPQEVRYELARSILLLNVGGKLADETLLDAALFGVPCVGSAKSALQSAFWPELVADTPAQGVRCARDLLTNAARLKEMSARARLCCLREHDPDEDDVERWLRRLHAAQAKIAAPSIHA